MKKFISISLLALILLSQIVGCSKQNQKQYSISNDFKNKSIELLDEIDNNDMSSDEIETNITTFVKKVDGNSDYTKDEQDLSQLIMNYYGQELLVYTAKISYGEKDDTYKKQKDAADSIRNEITQYLK